jgi:hypothetical protein
MLFQLPTSALILALVVLTEASSHGHGAHIANMRRRQLNPRGPQPVADPDVLPRASLGRRSCRKKASSSALPASTHSTIANTPSTTKKASTPTTSSPKATAAPPSSGGSVAAGNFKPVKPADWPTATQAGPTPTSTVASAHDPYLEELSKAIDNSGNQFFTETHTGDMTY